MPERPGTAARSARLVAARDRARRRPGSAGSFPPPPGAPGPAARPGCAGTPSAGCAALAAPPARAPRQGSAAVPAWSGRSISSWLGADAAERLLVLRRGSRGLHRQPFPVSVGWFGSLVPGGQYHAGVWADARHRRQLPPSLQRVLTEPLYHPDGHAAQRRRHPLGGGEDLPCSFGGLAFGPPSPRHMGPLLLLPEPG